MTGKAIYLYSMGRGESISESSDYVYRQLISRLMEHGISVSNLPVEVHVSECANAVKATVRGIEIPSGVRVSQQCDVAVDGLSFFEQSKNE